MTAGGWPVVGAAEIMRRLPYRYPMLLVDRVTEVVPGKQLTALKAVTASEPWFRGPEPMMRYPPVLLIESLCQATGLLAAWDAPRPSVRHGEVMLLGSLSDVDIQGTVEPGCLLRHQVRLVRSFGDTLLFTGSSAVGERPVLRVGQIVMAIRPATMVTARAPVPAP